MCSEKQFGYIKGLATRTNTTIDEEAVKQLDEAAASALIDELKAKPQKKAATPKKVEFQPAARRVSGVKLGLAQKLAWQSVENPMGLSKEDFTKIVSHFLELCAASEALYGGDEQ